MPPKGCVYHQWQIDDASPQFVYQSKGSSDWILDHTSELDGRGKGHGLH